MTDWQDRLVDAGLQELHGSRPPDLSARVLLALQEATPGALPVLRQRRSGWLRPALVAAALLLLGVAAGALLSRGAAPAGAQVVRLDLRVRTGELQCVEGGPAGVHSSQHLAGTHVAFAARVGNRLRTVEPCRFQVGPFGELATGPATELEVRSMTVNWQQGVVLGSSLTIAVVAGVVTWHTLSQGGTAKAGEVVELQARDGGDAALAAENAQLRERLQRLEQQNAELQLATAREPAPPAAVEEPPPPPPPEPVVAETAPVFADDAHAAALAALDWQRMGEVTKEMGPMLVDLVAAMEQDGELSMEVLAKIQALNSDLVAQVPALMKAGLPGSGPNGAYTHPLVTANILAKTLEAAGVAMDATQRAKIAGLVRAATAETQAVADASQEFELQRLASEAETKDRFTKEMSSLLTPEQYRVMFPQGADQYDGASLFHSSLFLRQFTEPVKASTPAEFARSVSNKIGEQLGFDEAASGQVRAIVERMSSAAPELFQQPANRVESELHMLRAGRTQVAMQRQIEIMREIVRQVPMTPAQKKQLLASKHLFVPLPQ